MAAPVTTTILFHGNSQDGWFAAYISHTFAKQHGHVQMFPVSTIQYSTFPRIDVMKGTQVLLVDVSVPAHIRAKWVAGGVVGIGVIDHHMAAAKEHGWPEGTIDTTRCSSLQAWQKFYPAMPIPGWLSAIDRITRWDNPTLEDRCLREILSIIAHKPTEKKMEEAFTLTESFFNTINNPVEFASIMENGKAMLTKKDTELMAILQAKGSIVVVGAEHCGEGGIWKLPPHWIGAQLFIIDNTNIVIDTTEASHIIFGYVPYVNAFINYRKKTLHGRGNEAKVTDIMVYSARSRPGFDLTIGTCLKGHPSSCGASLVIAKEPCLPFVIAGK